MVERYRKKSVVVEAVQFTGDNMLPVREFTNSTAYATTNRRMIIPTLEGYHIADPGDWIIRGVKGEFYPIKDEIFEATYEWVGPDGPNP